MDLKTLNSTLGEVSVIKKLVEDEWDIFIPLNGKTKFDIVAYKEEFGLISVQVKSTDNKKPSGSYEVGLRSVRSNKTTNTQYLFNNKIQDVLAIYIVEIDAVIFKISSAIENKSSLSITQLDSLNLSQKNLSEILRGRLSSRGC